MGDVDERLADSMSGCLAGAAIYGMGVCPVPNNVRVKPGLG